MGRMVWDHWVRAAVLTVPLAMFGCGDDGSTDTGAGTESATGTTSGVDGTGTMSTSTSTTTQGSNSASGSSDTTTAGTTTDTTTDSGGTADTTADATEGMDTGMVSCEADPNDSDCIACVKADCCEAYSTCQGDEDCTCFLDCLAEGNGPPQCAMDCEIVMPGQNPAIAGIFECQNTACEGACGGG